jgi:hypothetical protein
MRWKENPFSTEYWKECLKRYGTPKYTKEGLDIVYKALVGRVDDYFNKNFRSEEGVQVPILYLDGKLWMSITPMECQSMYIPKFLAEGVVGTAGLGMGMFVLDCMKSSLVEEIHVWEIDPRVINYFTTTFKKRKGFKKVKIHEGDARQLLKGQDLNFLFVDIYAQCFDYDHVIQDIQDFQANNNVETYHWWGQEKVLLAGLMDRLEPSLEMYEREYFGTWMQTKIGNVRLSDMVDNHIDSEFVEECLIAMERL